MLLRHEVCFIMGCIGQPALFLSANLISCAEDRSENPIVRHEALSAYSSISGDKLVMNKFLQDPEEIVRESCLVGIELIDYWHC